MEGLFATYAPIKRLSPGDQCGFEPEAFIAGSIWHARRTDNGREVALKLSSKAELSDDIRTALAEISGAYDHHLVPVIDARRVVNMAITVTPYFAEGTLAHYLARAAAGGDLVRARVLLSDMLAALTYLHGGNPRSQIIVHCDIKPDNILVHEGRYWLGDVDNALVRPANRAGASPHPATQRYAPPERYSSAFSESGDYWALGLVLAELLLGRHPFNVGEIFHDSADLPDDWLLHGAEFDTLPEDWRALLHGLTAKRREHRWGKAHLQSWLHGTEEARSELINEGLLLAYSDHVAARSPFTIHGVAVRTPAAAADEVLRCNPAPDAAMAAALGQWVESECDLPAMANRLRGAMVVADAEARRIQLALALNSLCPMAWQREAVSRSIITNYARNDDPARIAWIAGLRTHDLLGLYARFGNEEAAAMREAIVAAEAALSHSFRALADADCPLPLPDTDALWRYACQLAFAPQVRAVYLEQLAFLRSAKGLFDRPAWLNQFGYRLDTLSTEQLFALALAHEHRLVTLGTPEPVASDAIVLREGSDAELRAEPIIWLKTQERLLHSMQVTDIDTPEQVTAGQYYPPELRDLPLHHVREWLRRVIHPWVNRRLGRTAEQRWARVGRVGDALNQVPDIHLQATIYRAQATVEGYAKGPPTFACEVSWRVPEGGTMGYDVQLLLYRPGFFRDRLLWKTPMQTWLSRAAEYLFTPQALRVPYPTGLSRIGRMALSLCQDTIIRIRVEPRVEIRFRPVYYSDPIHILLPARELKLRQKTPLIKLKPLLRPIRIPLNRPESQILRANDQIHKSQQAIGKLTRMRARDFWASHRINAPADPIPRWWLNLTHWWSQNALRKTRQRRQAKTIIANQLHRRGQQNG